MEKDALTIAKINVQDPLFAQVFALREEVLRKPLGMSLYNEDTSADAEDDIFIALRDGRVQGCLMAKKLAGDEIKLRQMAVHNDVQKAGVGTLLMQAAEADARAAGKKKLVLHARETAVPFYERLGFVCSGSTFQEVGIPHKLMSKQL